MKRYYAFVPLLLAIVAVSIDGLRQSQANDMLFYADTETGDLSQWTDDKHPDTGWSLGGVWISGNGEANPSTDVAHSGSYSVALTIDGSAGVRMARRGVTSDPNLPDNGYYSVWFYFPQEVHPDSWWNVFQWKRAYQQTNGQSSSDPTGSVNIQNRDNGAMYFVYNAKVGDNGEINKRNIASADIDIPVGQWVQVECQYRWDLSNGKVKCWQDGQLLWDIDGIPTDFDYNGDGYVDLEHQRQWAVNNYSGGTNPSHQTIYIDDAAISLSRIGDSTAPAEEEPQPTEEPTTPPPAPETPEETAPPVVEAPAASGDTLYVSTSGSDSSPGTQAEPFRTLGHAVQAASAGTTIQMAAGNYQETVRINKSGSAQEGYLRIVGQGGAVIDGSGAGNDECIVGEGVSYIWVENLEIRNCYREGIRFSGSERNLISHITLRNLNVHDNGKGRRSWDHGIALEHVNTFEISNTSADNNYANGIFVVNSNTGLMQNIQANYNNGSYNGTQQGYFNDADGIAILNSHNIVVNNVRTDYNGEEGFDIGGWSVSLGNFSAPIDSYDIHVRNCVAHDNQNGGLSVSAEPGSNEMDAFDITFANCLVYANGVRINGSADGAGGYIGKERAYDVRLFNSIFSDNRENNFVVYLDGHDQSVKNSILSFVDWNRPTQINMGSGAYNLFADYNLIYTKNYMESLRGSNYIEQDPLFVNRQGGDYTLQGNSPAINTGGPLTLTTNAGSGQTIQVEEAKYFHDGFSMTQGDTIQVNTQVAVVVDIPNSNTIVLDRSISWQRGDWVSLPYSGSAPTIGLAGNISAEPPPPTEEPTTPPPATEEPTTPPPATEEPTTPPPSATEEPTTPPPSATEEPTTPPPSATEEPTTPPPSATEEPTTPPPSATEEPTTPPPSATEEATTDSSSVVVTQAPTQPTAEPTTPPPPADNGADDGGDNAPTDVQPPVALLGSDETQLEPGQCTTLNWQTGRATDVRLNGTTVAKAGSQEVCPAISTKYTLDATGLGGQASAITVVEVVATPPAEAPVVEPVDVCENNAALEVNVTYPGSTVTPSTSLSTSWYIRNTGSCTWDGSYTLVFTDGDPMDAPYTIALPYAVDPGRTAVMTIEMTAPASPGEYHGTWQVKAGDGTLFGQPLTADIVVTAPAGAPTSIDPEPQGRDRTPIWRFWRRLFERFSRGRSRNMISGFFTSVEPQRMMVWMFVLMVGLILSLALAVPPAWLMGRMRSRN